MTFLLDTNVVSEIRKVRSGKADPAVSAWVTGIPSGQLFVSAVTIHELEYGILLAEHRDPDKGALLRRWLNDSVASAFDQRIISMDAAIARRAAALHVPDPAPFRDSLIGATALVHQMVLVTRNVPDFDRFDGLRVHNPWGR